MEKTRHTQGLRILHHVIESKSWSILNDNEIKDSQFFGDSKVLLNFIRDYTKRYNDFPSLELSLTKCGISKMPNRECAEFCVDDFNKYRLSKEIQGIFKNVSDLAVSDPNNCLMEIKKKISSLTYTNAVKSFKNTSEDRYEDYVSESLNPLKGVIPAWPSLEDNFGVFENGTLNAVLGVTSTGKAQPLYSRILTPDGWKLMEDMEVGSEVIGPDSETYKVSKIYPQGLKDIYRLTFTTGETVDCCLDHLWKIRLVHNDYTLPLYSIIQILEISPGNIFVPVYDDVNGNSNNSLELKSIDYIGRFEAKCITVDSKEHLYVTDNFIVTHNCLDAETLCVTTSGKRVPIREIVEKKLKVVAFNMETGQPYYTSPSDWIYSGKKPCYKITMKTGDTLIATADHKIYTSHSWKRVGDLIPNKHQIARCKFLPRPFCNKEYVPDEMFIIGAMIADGSMSRPGSMYYEKLDQGLILRVKQCCNNLGIPFYQLPNEHGGLRWFIGSKQLNKVFKKYKVKHTTCYHKDVPNSILRMSNRNIAEFIAGVWNHDGTYVEVPGKAPIIRFSMAAPQLLESIRYLLIRLGIFSKLTHHEKYSDLIVPSECSKAFLEKIPVYRAAYKENGPFKDFKPTGYVRKKDNYSKLKDSRYVFWDRVKSIEPVGLRETYDLSIPVHHAFEANYTIVHNSWLSCVQALNSAFKQNKRTLLVTLENSKKSMDTRIESLYHRLPFGDIKKGLVDMRVQEFWQQNLSKLKHERGDIWVVDATRIRNIADLMQEVNNISPEFLIVDGAYKLQGDGQANWERANSVISDLESIAKINNIPVLATSQLNAAAQKISGGRMQAFESRFTKNWITDPSCVVCLTQSDDDIILNRVLCTIAKNREGSDPGSNLAFYIRQDRVRMDFSEIMEEYLDEDLLKQLL